MLRGAAPLLRALRSSARSASGSASTATATSSAAATSTQPPPSSASSSSSTSTTTGGGDGEHRQRQHLRGNQNARQPWRRDNYEKGEERGGGGQGRTLADKRRFRRMEKVVDEHTELLRKHGDAIVNAEVDTLHDAVEKVEWYATIMPSTLKKFAELLKRAKRDELAALSDRQLATLLSAYGTVCDAMPAAERAALLKDTVQSLRDKDFTLGPAARTAHFAARIDNAQKTPPSVVEEIREWDVAGVPLSEDVVVQLARVYALEGDKKGVVELVSHAKSAFGRVDARFLEWLAYAVVAQEGGAEGALATVEKLTPSTSSPSSTMRIWTTAAKAAARRGDAKIAAKCLSRVPLGAQLDALDNNVAAVEVLVALVEEGVADAEQRLLPYIVRAEEEPEGVLRVHEKHPSNAKLLSATRRAIGEGNLETALRIFALVHREAQTQNFKSLLFTSACEWVARENVDGEAALRVAQLLQREGIVQDHAVFLLRNLRTGPELANVVRRLRKEEKLGEAVGQIGERKMRLAKNVFRAASSDSVPEGIALAAAVLAAPKLDRREDAFRELYYMAKKDVEVVTATLQHLEKTDDEDNASLRRLVLTAALHEMLTEKDSLQSGRLIKLLDGSGNAQPLVGYFTGRIARSLLQARGVEQEEASIEVSAKIFAAAMSRRSEYTSRAMCSLAGISDLRKERVKALYQRIVEKGGARVPREIVKEEQTRLRGIGQEERAEMLEMLKERSQTVQRWLTHNSLELEKFLNKLEGQEEKAKVGVVRRLQAIITQKIHEELTAGNCELERAVAWVERAAAVLKELGEKREKEEKSVQFTTASLCNETNNLRGTAMDKAVREQEWSSVERLLQAQADTRILPMAATLTYAAHVMFEAKDEKKAAEIAEIIRLSGQGINAHDVHKMGELFAFASPSSVSLLTAVDAWLQHTFGLDARVAARVHSVTAMQRLHELIKSGKLKEALEFAREQTERCGHAFGFFDLLREATKRADTALIQSTVDMVSKMHSRESALLDLALVFLLERRAPEAEKLLKIDGLLVSTGKLRYFAGKALEEDRIDILHSLFSALDECIGAPGGVQKVSNADLNWLALKIAAYYESRHDWPALRAFVDNSLKTSNTVHDAPLQELLRRTEKSREKRESKV